MAEQVMPRVNAAIAKEKKVAPVAVAA
jgi:hypothetical protein